MTVGPPYWVEVLTKGGREIIWTTLPDRQVGYFCLPGLIPVGRYIPITPVIELGYLYNTFLRCHTFNKISPKRPKLKSMICLLTK